jgi:hypothetical protein
MNATHMGFFLPRERIDMGKRKSSEKANQIYAKKSSYKK